MDIFTPLSEIQLRQQVNGEAVFQALETARLEQAAMRGSMFWHTSDDKTYLVRKQGSGKQTSLGPKTPELELVYNRFVTRKNKATERVRALSESLLQQQRFNKAARVGRVPNIVVDLLNEFARVGLSEHFVVVGTNALFAYESRCGVRIGVDAMVTEDVDLFFDAQKHLKFIAHLERMDETLLAILRRTDKSFQVREDQLYTAINDQGYQVDFIRRPTKLGDVHPMRMASKGDEEAIWAVQVPGGEALASAKRFEQIVTSTTGVMARMRTISPVQFIEIKRASGEDIKRDPKKARKDLLQAAIVERLVEEFSIETPAYLGEPLAASDLLSAAPSPESARPRSASENEFSP